MIKIHFPTLHSSFEAEEGIGLLDLAQRHSIPLNSYCGGRGTCGKCLVKIQGEASPLSLAEEKFQSSSALAPGERLACQVQIWGDAEVQILPTGLGKMEKALGRTISPLFAVDPGIRKWSLARPDSLRSPSSSTWGIVQEILQREVKDPQIDWRTLQALADQIWTWDSWTAVLAGSRLLGIEPKDTTDRVYGMALDIGTTTVVGYLLDLVRGSQLALASTLNPQAAFGADVISRISFAGTNPSGLSLLQARIIHAVNSLVEEAAGSAGVSPDEIYALSVVGNTTMHHLLLGLDPSGMGHLPYNPILADSLEVSASDLGIRICPQAPIFLLPNVAGYVGSDIVAGILSTRLPEREKIALGIDIGTNGEMALGSRNQILVASAAAGPAFEGSQITCGMRAEPGAISQVLAEDGDIRWKVVGEVPPRGLCGSGLVDLVAVLLRLGLIDEGGRFRGPDLLPASVPQEIRGRMRRAQDGWDFFLDKGGEGSRPVILAQRDIRELQLAKGAIRAGIDILLDELGIDISQVEEIWLAGAFGNYIDPANAQTIGLLPPYPQERISPVGNAAGEGAKMALLSQSARREASRIARTVRFIELASRPDFQETFVEALVFPPPDHGA